MLASNWQTIMIMPKCWFLDRWAAASVPFLTFQQQCIIKFLQHEVLICARIFILLGYSSVFFINIFVFFFWIKKKSHVFLFARQCNGDVATVWLKRPPVHVLMMPANSIVVAVFFFDARTSSTYRTMQHETHLKTKIMWKINKTFIITMDEQIV